VPGLSAEKEKRFKMNTYRIEKLFIDGPLKGIVYAFEITLSSLGRYKPGAIIKCIGNDTVKILTVTKTA
jgi:hypothetical protein